MRKQGSKNLSYKQRLQIETLFKAKMSNKNIALQVGVCLRTIQRELKRGECGNTSNRSKQLNSTKYSKVQVYSSELAQEKYKENCAAKGRPLKIGSDHEIINYINNRVENENITPHAVWGDIMHRKLQFKTVISKATLYNYMKLGLIKNKVIGTRKKKYKREMKYTKKFNHDRSIEKRPQKIEDRTTFGNWEMDCVCGTSKVTFLVLTERLTRQEIIFKMEDQKSASVVACVNILEKKFGNKFSKIFKTITVDNGPEFLDFVSLEKSINTQKQKRTQIYYCHPFCSCERGTNERINREIRRLVPKGTNLAKYSNLDVKQIENWINNYPRKVLGFATSQELFNYYLKQIV